MSAALPEFITLSIDKLVPSRWQPRQRFDPASLLDLAQDIALHGVITPTLVWINEDNEFELIAGERRTRALYALCLVHSSESPLANHTLESTIEEIAEKGFAHLRAEVSGLLLKPGPDPAFSMVACRLVTAPPAQLHELAIIENIQRADLAPIEEAHALRDLIQEHGYSQRELGERIGKSQTWISQRLVLLDLCDEVAGQLIAGEIETSVARDVARVPTELQAAVAAHIRKYGMKQKAASNFIARLLTFVDPDAWIEIAGQDFRRYGLVVQEFLRRMDPADRYKQILTRLATDLNQGRLTEPAERYAWDRFIAELGLTGHRYDGLDDAWNRLFGAPAQAVNATDRRPAYAGDRVPAPEVTIPSPAAPLMDAVVDAVDAVLAQPRPTCETCVLFRHRDLVVRTTQACKDVRQEPTALWPRCAPEVDTCLLHTPAGTPLKLDLPDVKPALITDQELPLIQVSEGSYGYKVYHTSDILVWSTIMLRRVAALKQNQAQAEEIRIHGVANALRRYVAEQVHIEAGHIYSQPCSRCAFYTAQDERCERIHHPPEPPYGNTAIAAVLRLGDRVDAPEIGRCVLFRQAELGNLPLVPLARFDGPHNLLLAILHAMSLMQYGNGYRAAAWLPVERRDPYDAPSWSDSESYLKRALAVLDGRQRASVLAAWLPHYSSDGLLSGAQADPMTGKEASWNPVRVFRSGDPAPKAGELPGVNRPLVDVLVGRELADIQDKLAALDALAAAVPALPVL